MTVDNPDYVSTIAQHVGKFQAFTSGARVINPSGQYSTGLFSMTKPGYVIWMTAIMAANAANPFCQVDLTWRDSVSGNLLGQEEWVIPAGTPLALRTNGRGQAKGDQLNVLFTNLDAAQSVTIHLAVYETTFAAARDDLRSDMNANWTTTAAGITAAPCARLSNTLFQGNPTIPASSFKSFQMGLYAGQVNAFEQDGGASPCKVTIQPTQLLETASAAVPVVEFAGSAVGVGVNVPLPRQPCLVVISNPNAAAVVASLTVGLLEFAS